MDTLPALIAVRDLAQSAVNLLLCGSTEHQVTGFVLMDASASAYLRIVDSLTALLVVALLVLDHLVVGVAGRELDKLLEDGHLTGFLSHDSHRDLVVRVAWYCALRQKLDNLRVSDPLVVLRIYPFQQFLNFRVHILLKTEQATFAHLVHISDKLLELMLV